MLRGFSAQSTLQSTLKFHDLHYANVNRMIWCQLGDYSASVCGFKIDKKVDLFIETERLVFVLLLKICTLISTRYFFIFLADHQPVSVVERSTQKEYCDL